MSTLPSVRPICSVNFIFVTGDCGRPTEIRRLSVSFKKSILLLVVEDIALILLVSP